MNTIHLTFVLHLIPLYTSKYNSYVLCIILAHVIAITIMVLVIIYFSRSVYSETSSYQISPPFFSFEGQLCTISWVLSLLGSYFYNMYIKKCLKLCFLLMLRTMICVHVYMILDFLITECACLHKTVHMVVFVVKSDENTYSKGRAFMQTYRVVPITKRGNLSTGNLVLWTLHQVITPQCKTSTKLEVTNASHWAEKTLESTGLEQIHVCLCLKFE